MGGGRWDMRALVSGLIICGLQVPRSTEGFDKYLDQLRALISTYINCGL